MMVSMIFYAISILANHGLDVAAEAKYIQVTVTWFVSMEKEPLVSSCMRDPPRRQALGAVEVQPGAAFLPRGGQVQKSARISRMCIRVLGLLPEQAA